MARSEKLVQRPEKLQFTEQIDGTTYLFSLKNVPKMFLGEHKRPNQHR